MATVGRSAHAGRWELRAHLEWRLLINYRMDPRVLGPILPRPLRPCTVDGQAVAGVCVLRLRPTRFGPIPLRRWPMMDAAAHRIAVTWEEAGQTHRGVYVPGRLTSSRLAQWTGGRMFPGICNRAAFDTRMSGDGALELRLSQPGIGDIVQITATPAEGPPPESVFRTTGAASAFFRDAPVGWSPGRHGDLEGLEWKPDTWNFQPMQATRVETAFFADTRRFPQGSVAFDSAFLMEGIPHAWRPTTPPAHFDHRIESHRHRLTTFLELP